jgi:hypothetical protein
MTPWQSFLDLVERSIIVQAIVTLVLIATDCTLWLTGKTPSSELLALTFAVIGFWFGSKIENAKLTNRAKV